MDALLAEWIDKAEADAVAFEHLYAGGEPRLADVVTFHAQQCAEKYLKARLYAATGSEPPRQHDLLVLLNAVAPHEPSWQALVDDLALLSRFATRYRYPGLTATLEDATDAVAACRRFRSAARQALGLDQRPAV